MADRSGPQEKRENSAAGGRAKTSTKTSSSQGKFPSFSALTELLNHVPSYILMTYDFEGILGTIKDYNNV